MICTPRLKRYTGDQITRKIRWAEHVARMGVERRIRNSGGETWGERNQLEDPGVDGG
jgi:hypothetical protein